MHKSIEIKNLYFSYDETPILERVDLSVERGEFVGIFGPNGGGKTTLLKLVAGFLKPSHGSVVVSAPRGKIGYVPQAAHFDKQFPISTLEVVLMGALSSLSFWGGYTARVRRRAMEELERVGIAAKAKQPFGTLSGGEAQRALIARALLSEPEILLLDEPTASVDAEAQQEIYRLLVTLRGSVTTLMVTHDLQIASRKVDRVLCVQKSVSPMSTQEVCEHFALGLYHAPLLPGGKR